MAFEIALPSSSAIATEMRAAFVLRPAFWVTEPMNDAIAIGTAKVRSPRGDR